MFCSRTQNSEAQTQHALGLDANTINEPLRSHYVDDGTIDDVDDDLDDGNIWLPHLKATSDDGGVWWPHLMMLMATSDDVDDGGVWWPHLMMLMMAASGGHI